MEKGLDESVALQNARLAKVLQCEDYDFSTQQVRPWLPTSASVGPNNGATVQDASD